MTKTEITGNALGIGALIALPFVLALVLYLNRRARASAATIGQARPDRGKGIPLDDIQRAMRHYNISREEYLAHPEAYPLPDRGAGLYG